MKKLDVIRRLIVTIKVMKKDAVKLPFLCYSFRIDCISAKVFHFLINGNVYSILLQITNVFQITKPNARKQEDVLTMTICAMVN